MTGFMGRRGGKGLRMITCTSGNANATGIGVRCSGIHTRGIITTLIRTKISGDVVAFRCGNSAIRPFTRGSGGHITVMAIANRTIGSIPMAAGGCHARRGHCEMG